jgi:hypothetical protein
LSTWPFKIGQSEEKIFIKESFHFWLFKVD